MEEITVINSTSYSSPMSEDEAALLSVSSGDAGTGATYVVYSTDPENNAAILEALQGIAETQEQILLYNEQILACNEQILECNELVLASNEKAELQNEASISIFLIFLIVGLLNYIYKFFKMFF